VSEALSPRLAAILEALPLEPQMRVLEIGCGPGALARAMSDRVAFVLGIDRSAKAVAQAMAGSVDALKTKRLDFRISAVEEFQLQPGEAPFDLAVAIRVGALDGRHPDIEAAAHAAIRAALKPGGRLFIDGGAPLREIELG
jgi:cyclopropane fatty-acyl-phospholipid synthase-like methyltransferase